MKQGTNELDVRRLLTSGHFEGPVELFRFGGGSQVPVGVVSVRADLQPDVRPGSGLSEQYVSEHLRDEHARQAKAESDFDAYARRWLTEFESVAMERPVALFARSELGFHQCICSFVTPVRNYVECTFSPHVLG
eukprot:SAG31_NODE_4233_length_3434_cov_1.980810_4_plen_134_part_00